ncbi:hypothetical protein LPBF_01970 [Flavobacterium crassostreae]|uniref:Uncharacterized protein n=1 Tax=Flavobacterium crassostreae TaxID=1763534 RepID=A0A1B9E9Z4_9FLAO|nr:hypothetical protein LPBF_01970 [Flavobacterium crassostreae]
MARPCFHSITAGSGCTLQSFIAPSSIKGFPLPSLLQPRFRPSNRAIKPQHQPKQKDQPIEQKTKKIVFYYKLQSLYLQSY